jgi:hypothetical protein
VRGSQAGARCRSGGSRRPGNRAHVGPPQISPGPNHNGIEPKTDTRGVGKG